MMQQPENREAWLSAELDRIRDRCAKLESAMIRAKPYLDAFYYDAETGIEDGTYEDLDWFNQLASDMRIIERTLEGIVEP